MAAKFDVGQLIHHRLFDYRGAVFDIDAEYRGSEEWYELVARTRPPRDQPWYHVLVHGSHETTYVAERNLERDKTGEAVEHPLIDQIFQGLEDGRYVARLNVN